MPDQRSLLRGRLFDAIDGVADAASRLDPPAARPAAPQPPAAPVGRPWTPAAAKEPIASPTVDRAAPLRPPPPASAPEPGATPPIEVETHRRFPVAIIGSAVIGLVVIAVLLLRLLHSSPGAPPAITGQIALTDVRPVASSGPLAGTLPATQISFPAGTATVSIDVNSGTRAGQAPVEIVVAVRPLMESIIDRNYVLNASGQTIIPLTPAGGAYAPGDYMVTITSNGSTLGSTAFEVG